MKVEVPARLLEQPVQERKPAAPSSAPPAAPPRCPPPPLPSANSLHAAPQAVGWSSAQAPPVSARKSVTFAPLPPRGRPAARGDSNITYTRPVSSDSSGRAPAPAPSTWSPPSAATMSSLTERGLPRGALARKQPSRASSAEPRRPRREEPVTPGQSPPVFPTQCRCGGQLRWRQAEPTTRCPSCQLTAALSPRGVAQPAFPPPPDSPRRFASPLDDSYHQVFTADTVLQSEWCGRRVPEPPVDFFRWASARHHPDNRGTVVVCVGAFPVAALPHRHAAYLRAGILAQRFGVPTNEADVAAYMAAWCLAVPAAEWPSPPARARFKNQRQPFADWDILPEPGLYRPALLASKPGRLPFAHPASSAYESVLRFNSPVSAEGHHALLSRHPHGPFLVNCLRYGFPLMSSTPPTSRPWRGRLSDTNTSDTAKELIKEELEEGSLVPAPQGIPLRFAPLNVIFSNKWRLVSDLTIGKGSVNTTTSRGGLPPIRLAKLPTLAMRINWMHEQRPGAKVLLFKFDIRRAFRQLPLAVRDFHRTAHHTVLGDVVNARLMLGAAASCDLMGASVMALSDAIAASHGIFTDVYVDDMVVATYEDEAAPARDTILSLWHRLGWPLNAKKLDSDGQPTTVCTFLGVTFNTELCTAAVSPERMEELLQLISDWLEDPSHRRRRRDYASLAGKLQFVSDVIPYGKVFLRAIHFMAQREPRWVNAKDTLCVDDGFWSTARPHLPGDVEHELLWWRDALAAFNGVACFAPEQGKPVIRIFTDASGIGGAAVNATGEAFIAWEWSPEERDNSSTAHWEAAAILAAIEQFGPEAVGGVIDLRSDSWASVAMFARARCVDRKMFDILRDATLLQLRLGVRLEVSHIPGRLNAIADVPSRTGCMPPQLHHYKRCELPDTLRSHLSALLGGSQRQGSTGSTTVTPRSSTGSAAARTLASTPRPVMPWQPWMRTKRALASASSSWTGSSSTPEHSLATPSPATSPLPPHTVKPLSVTSGHSPPSTTSSPDNSPQHDVCAGSRIPSPRSTSVSQSSISASPSPSAVPSPSCLPKDCASMKWCASASLSPTPKQAGAISGGESQCDTHRCVSPMTARPTSRSTSASPTATTPARRSTSSPPPTADPPALSASSAISATTWDRPPLMTPKRPSFGSPTEPSSTTKTSSLHSALTPPSSVSTPRTLQATHPASPSLSPWRKRATLTMPRSHRSCGGHRHQRQGCAISTVA